MRIHPLLSTSARTSRAEKSPESHVIADIAAIGKTESPRID